MCFKKNSVARINVKIGIKYLLYVDFDETKTLEKTLISILVDLSKNF